MVRVVVVNGLYFSFRLFILFYLEFFIWDFSLELAVS